MAKKKAVRIGRPPKPAKERRNKTYGLKVTADEFAELKSLTTDEARSVLLKAARRKR